MLNLKNQIHFKHDQLYGSASFYVTHEAKKSSLIYLLALEPKYSFFYGSY